MIEINVEKCNGCRRCSDVCPHDVIKIAAKRAVIADYASCMECGACQLNCEQNAITLTKGTGCIAAIIKEDFLKIAPKGTGCCGSGGLPGGGCC